MMTDDDRNQLRLLSIFHFILGGIGCLFSFFPVIHLVVGIAMIFAPGEFEANEEFPMAIGWFFVGIASLFILVGLAGSICVILAGRYLMQHRHHTFCLVIAAIQCLFMPLGTILGVFTIVVLMKQSVKNSFQS
mgnify:CR=1 FL=1